MPVCLQPNSCDDITPVSEPGVQFKCPAFREFDPAKADNSWPNEDRCCSKVRGRGQAETALGGYRVLGFRQGEVLGPGKDSTRKGVGLRVQTRQGVGPREAAVASGKAAGGAA
jgi:hypothetical protein